MNRIATQIFRLHSLCAQLLFESANSGTLQENADSLASYVCRYAEALGIPVTDGKAESLVDQIVRETEVRLPDMFWVAEVAQTATLRLLYRNTNVEDTDDSEIMALELTAFLAAKKGGIPEDRFMAWHRLMFDDLADPRKIVSELESLVLEFSSDDPNAAKSGSEMIEPIEVKVPIIPGFVSIDVKKAVKAIRARIQKSNDS